MTISLLLGDCLEQMGSLPDCSVSSIVTDPPYGLSFMGKKWDHGVPSIEVWQECLRVLKPGGYLLAFAGTRTQHRMAVNIEDAGFEIRDMIAWVYGSGFPKSLDVSKAIDKAAGAEREVVGKKVRGDVEKAKTSGTTYANADANKNNKSIFGYGVENITVPATPEAHQWEGWGTALKPALEPITVARKPFNGTVAENVLKHGTGAINVDGCRVGAEVRPLMVRTETVVAATSMSGTSTGATSSGELTTQGRWPANLIHDGSDEVVGLFPEANSARAGGNPNNPKRGTNHTATSYGQGDGKITHDYRDTGSAARFFYCAKASKRERGEGNNHPTVKPVSLMRYLCRLVTPPKGIILDPFMGSGSTGIAALEEGFDFIGIERELEYMAVAQRRIEEVEAKLNNETT